MVTFTVPGVSILANMELDSPGVSPGNFNQAIITLVDTNLLWDSTPGHILNWGLKQSTDAGATWTWGPINQKEPAPGLPFGARGKGGGMPSLLVDSSVLQGGSTYRLRLAILTDAAIVLGATITVT